MGESEERFDHLSPAKRALLSQRLRGLRLAGARHQLPTFERGRRRASLTFAQGRLYKRVQIEAPDARNHFFVAQIRGDLDLDLLRLAGMDFLERHPGIASTFRDGPNGVEVVYDPVRSIDFEVKCVDSGDGYRTALEQASIEGRRPYDIVRGPLLRVRVYRIDDRHFVLLLAVHLLVFDVWSMGVAIRDLSALYNARLSGREVALPELDYQYGDLAAWQHERLADGYYDDQLAYWRNRLRREWPLISLPGRAAPPNEDRQFEERCIDIRLGGRPWRDVREFARGRGVSPYTVLHAAFDAFLHGLTDITDLVVGMPIANRNLPGTADLVGYMPNVLPIRIELDPSSSFSVLLEQVRRVLAAAYANQDLPFDRFEAELLPERRRGRPLSRILFSVQNTPIPSFELDSLHFEPVLLDYGVMAPFDLTLLIIESEVLVGGDGDGVGGSIHCNANLFSEQQVRFFWNRYVRELGALLAKPEIPLRDLQRTSTGEEGNA